MRVVDKDTPHHCLRLPTHTDLPPGRGPRRRTERTEASPRIRRRAQPRTSCARPRCRCSRQTAGGGAGRGQRRAAIQAGCRGRGRLCATRVGWRLSIEGGGKAAARRLRGGGGGGGCSWGGQSKEGAHAPSGRAEPVCGSSRGTCARRPLLRAVTRGGGLRGALEAHEPHRRVAELAKSARRQMGMSTL